MQSITQSKCRSVKKCFSSNGRMKSGMGLSGVVSAGQTFQVLKTWKV